MPESPSVVPVDGVPARVAGRAAERRGVLRQLMVWSALALSTRTALTAPSLTLPKTTSLPDSLTQALRVREPLVVMVSLPGCPFCTIVREHHLVHLRSQGGQVVQIDMRDHTPLLDFDGQALTQDAWIRQRRIKLAPTVLFFGPGGQEVAKRLDGAYLPDFYAAYFDEQYRVARLAVSAK
jgi:hypothetical protein